MDNNFLYKLVEHGGGQFVKAGVSPHKGNKPLRPHAVFGLGGDALFQFRRLLLQCALLGVVLHQQTIEMLVGYLPGGVPLVQFPD